VKFCWFWGNLETFLGHKGSTLENIITNSYFSLEKYNFNCYHLLSHLLEYRIKKIQWFNEGKVAIVSTIGPKVSCQTHLFHLMLHLTLNVGCHITWSIKKIRHVHVKNTRQYPMQPLFWIPTIACLVADISSCSRFSSWMSDEIIGWYFSRMRTWRILWQESWHCVLNIIDYFPSSDKSIYPMW